MIGSFVPASEVHTCFRCKARLWVCKPGEQFCYNGQGRNRQSGISCNIDDLLSTVAKDTRGSVVD